MKTPKFQRTIEVLDSSMIKSLQYDPMTQVLDAAFKKGGIYRFFGVSHLEFCLLITSESTGKAFHAMILGKKKSEKTRKESM